MTDSSNVPLGRVESSWLDVGGKKMHARRAIDSSPAGAPPVVLVHGLLVSSRYMVPLVQHLAPWFPVHAPDLPGFGLSESADRILDVDELADALAAWMDAARIERASLVANSFGCQIAAHFGVRHPGRVDRIVLQGPSTDRHARNALVQIGRWATCGLYEPFGIIPVIFRDYLGAGLRAFLQTYRFMLRDRIEEMLPRVEAPTMVVCGTNDAIVPRSWAEELAGLLPRGELRVVPGSAHAMNFSSPLELCRVARPFLSGSMMPASR